MTDDGGDHSGLAQGPALSEFGQRAAQSVDLDELLQDAAREAAQLMDVSHVKVLEYLPDEKRLLVRAGVGWGPDVVGQATVGADFESPAGYALQTGRPVISNELHKEERFRVPDLLREHGVKSAVNVLIRSPRHVFGVLEADSRDPREFAEEHVRFLQGYATVLSFAIEQARLVEANAALAAEKELLLRELQHRVRNNNQQLISLVSLQLAGLGNLEARDQLEKVAQRIHALTEVNEHLRVGGRPDVVDLANYLLAIIASLVSFRGAAAPEVRLETDLAQMEIATGRAQAIGLIVNEFLTNSFKHAFAERGGVLTVTLGQQDGTAVLTLADDGPGLPADRPSGLGTRLIELLSRQIAAEADWSDGPGAQLTLRFPLKVA